MALLGTWAEVSREIAKVTAVRSLKQKRLDLLQQESSRILAATASMEEKK